MDRIEIRNPMDLYRLFISFAIVGRMADADHLMNEYADIIRMNARLIRSREKFKLRKPLYRGIILDREGLTEVPACTERTFSSFTEEMNCAFHFADIHSNMNDFLALNPVFKNHRHSYVIEYAPKEEEILFHYSWAKKIKLEEFIDAQAWAHPILHKRALKRLIKKQAEVILDNLGQTFPLKPLALYNPPSTEELNALNDTSEPGDEDVGRGIVMINNLTGEAELLGFENNDEREEP